MHADPYLAYPDRMWGSVPVAMQRLGNVVHFEEPQSLSEYSKWYDLHCRAVNDFVVVERGINMAGRGNSPPNSGQRVLLAPLGAAIDSRGPSSVWLTAKGSRYNNFVLFAEDGVNANVSFRGNILRNEVPDDMLLLREMVVLSVNHNPPHLKTNVEAVRIHGAGQDNQKTVFQVYVSDIEGTGWKTWDENFRARIMRRSKGAMLDAA